MAGLGDAPVVAEVVRSGAVESVHHGTVLALAADGTVAFAVGDPQEPVYPRSSNKPLQAVAMLRHGLDLDGELLALAAASHSGEDFHVDGARRILASVGLDESALQCPPALPMDEATLRAHLRAGGGPGREHMNCSGKHAAMLATCVLNGWPTGSYLDPDHPLQAACRRVIEELSGERVAAIGVDGCGAPVHAYSLVGLARAFRALVLAPAGSPEHRVAAAYRAFPAWTSGTTREENLLMRAVPGLVNKAGAEGIDALALPDGRAVTIKIADGNARARVPVALAALRRLGVDTPPAMDFDATAVLGGGRPVGEVRAVGI